jgi:chromatin remodeling complex protein RSC6
MSSTNTPTSSIMSASAPVKVAKKTVTKSAAAPTPVAAPAPVVVVAEPTAKKVVAKKAVKAEAAVAAPVVVAPVSAPAAEAAGTVAPATTLDEDLKAVMANLSTLRETAAAMVAQVKKLEKRVHREIKDARKRKRRVKVDENGVEVKRAPSIFERPTQISNELCHFLGKSNGTLMSRSEVTKAVNVYVKDHSLKNKHDIKPDAPLKKLLGVPEGEQLTYFNLQRYLNKHYIKATPTA